MDQGFTRDDHCGLPEAFRQADLRVATDGADHRQAQPLDGRAHHGFVPLAGGLVEHDAANAHGGVVGGEAMGDGAGGL